MKLTAYRTEFGNERVYADEHQRERNALNDGKPLGGFIAWTLDPPGQRKKLKHVYRGVTPHFEYVSKSDSDTQGGESLAHLLFKEAVSEIKKTHLCLNNGEKFPIVITYASLEEHIKHDNGNHYYVDVYLKFESDHFYAEKWSGEIFFEVCHHNPVHKEKRDDLYSLRFPVIEYKLKKPFIYEYDESNTSRWREERHKAMIKKILEGENGFIPARILSDPSSVAFLERELEKRTTERNQAKSLCEKKQSELDNALSREASLSLEVQNLTKKEKNYRTRIDALEDSKKELNISFQKEITSHAHFKRMVTIAGLILFSILSISTIALILLWPTAKANDSQPSSVVNAPTTTQSSPPEPTPMSTKHASQKKHRHLQ